MALLIRQTAPLAVGIVVAASFIVGKLVLLIEKVIPVMAFGVVFLLGVLVVSDGWGFGLAVTTTFVSAPVYAFFHLNTEEEHLPPSRARTGRRSLSSCLSRCWPTRSRAPGRGGRCGLAPLHSG